MLRRLIGEDVELEVALPAETPPIRADLGQIEQVIVNLAVNARDAMPHGGLLRIATAAVELDGVGAAGHGLEPGVYAALSVSDTGIGIDAKIRAHIFEPFFTTKETGKGTGLGLSTVANIVRQAGGAIEVVSEPGDGTTFRVLLPAAKSIQEIAEERPSRRAEAVVGATILLVEDHEQIRSVIRRILVADGYNVVEAESGEAAELAALALAEKDEPLHLLVTDVVMAGADGRATAVRLRALHPRLRVIYMSGYAQHARPGDGARHEPGAIFLPKPFSVDQLAAAVRSALEV
jgi:CheY-like chemotaxis protein